MMDDPIDMLVAENKADPLFPRTAEATKMGTCVSCKQDILMTPEEKSWWDERVGKQVPGDAEGSLWTLPKRCTSCREKKRIQREAIEGPRYYKVKSALMKQILGFLEDLEDFAILTSEGKKATDTLKKELRKL